MFVKKVSFLILALTLFGHSTAHLLCNCGLGSGEDVCSGRPSSQCTPLVVRPIDIPRPTFQAPKVVCTPVGGITPLVPLPGPCSCTKAIVKPAVVPRPACKACSCNHQSSSTSLFEQQQNSNQIYFNTNGNSAGSNGNLNVQYNSFPSDKILTAYPYQTSQGSLGAPADAVSLSIAYNMAQKACTQSEDKLAFGFRKLPKELPPTPKKTNNIPEENLYSLNGQIVELKPVQCGSTQSLDEEAADELLALSEEAIEPAEIRKISLGDIGYGPARIVSAPFIDVPVANPEEVLAEAALESHKCNDGFVPGGVIFKTVPKPKSVVIQPEMPCDEAPEVPDLPAPAQIQQSYGCGCNPCGGFFKSSSSALSSQARQSSSSVFFDKLGCL